MKKNVRAKRYEKIAKQLIEIPDQYKEKKNQDPTIAEKFNAYKFTDYKEKVIDLLGRVESWTKIQ